MDGALTVHSVSIEIRLMASKVKGPVLPSQVPILIPGLTVIGRDPKI